MRAALAIGEAVAGLNAEQEWLDLHIRTAVNTGEAFVVVGASAVEGEGLAAGDVMNTAARLQSAAPVDGIAVGEATFRATQHVFEYGEAEPIAAKGKAEPVPVWIVLGEKAVPKRPEPWGPLVGRDEQMTQLLDVYERVSAEGRADTSSRSSDRQGSARAGSSSNWRNGSQPTWRCTGVAACRTARASPIGRSARS